MAGVTMGGSDDPADLPMASLDAGESYLQRFLDDLKPGESRSWREPGAHVQGDVRVAGLCAKCATTLVLVTWPADGDAAPIVRRARRLHYRRLDLAWPGPPEIRRGNSGRLEAKHRWIGDGPPIEKGAQVVGECDCGMHYRASPKALRKRARDAHAA
jgi:hypothetical protein